MATEIIVQVTPQEMRIPLDGLEAWKDKELEMARKIHACDLSSKTKAATGA